MAAAVAEVAGGPGPRRHHGEGRMKARSRWKAGNAAAEGPRGGRWGDAERACNSILESCSSDRGRETGRRGLETLSSASVSENLGLQERIIVV